MSKIGWEKYGISQAEYEQIKQYFDLFDPNSTGRIDPHEIRRVLSEMGEQIKSQTVYQQICKMCSQGRNTITFEQFLPLMTSKILKNQPSAHFQQLLDLIDDDKHGFITIQSLSRAIESVNIEASEQTLQLMMKLADKDKDLCISGSQLQDLLDQIHHSKNKKK